MPVLVARQPDGYDVQIQSKNVKQKIYLKKKKYWCKVVQQNHHKHTRHVYDKYLASHLWHFDSAIPTKAQ